ncbi:YtxH domain-containing protein [Paenibacillus sp. HB172176]|uniref:YtxH domain-containing protein n=1 Tax=Paenibacillus sp. HB172176 TaxID=2493690 RepID=UPI00143A37A7|nr:YtxH domain-containing protein [Paenibacillus sp. HB172176]
MSTKKGTKGFLFGAIAGGVIGSITALLLAPKAGKELREDISAGAHKVGDSTLKTAGKVGEATGRLAKGIGSGAVQIADRTKEAAESAARSIRNLRGRPTGEGEVAAISAVHDGVEEIAGNEAFSDGGEERTDRIQSDNY